ncbi:uncharacterized protein LOC134653308 [Cydia amplana]|uniref:uncharacterized protein LOC134653308 n=1 Tax=Cydia amplana TaxID=1869771 RepID=UPI002FE5D5F7
MSVFRLNSCCCCINLDVGAKITGFVCVLFAAASATLFAVPALLLRLPPATMLFYSVAAVTSALQFITGCAMICGLFQKRPSLVQPWLLLTWTVCGSLLLLSGAGTVMMYVNGDVSDSYVTSIYSLYSMILFYLAVVVRSRREELLDEIKWDSGKRLMRPLAIEKNLYV